MEVIIFIGIQASGKSTFYKQQFADSHMRMNLDMLRTRTRELAFLKACFDTEMSFAVDNTNPTKADRQRYIVPARQKNAIIKGYYFQTSIADCLERNASRTGKQIIPDRAIMATYAKIEMPDYSEGFHELYYVHMDEHGGFVVLDWDKNEE